MPPPAIEVQRLTKIFEQRPVVDELSFAVPTGSVCGLVGSNGAGKTTTVRMLLGHLHPTAGAVRTFGGDPRRHAEQVLRRIAYVSETMAIPWWMTPEKAIRMNAALFPDWDGALAERLLDEFGLRRQGRFGALSQGQKRKTLILLALCQSAELLIFDEPTTGLDVESRRAFLDCLLDVAAAGNRTVLLSSHILSDLERVVDRMVILRNGRLLLEGNLEELKAGVRKLQIAACVPLGVLEEHFRVHSCEYPTEGETLATVLDFSESSFERFVSSLPSEARLSVQTHGFNLEDLYLELATHRRARSQEAAVAG